VDFREDPSNRSIAYRRTHIRYQLLPLLAREYNPRIVESLAGLATQAREDEDVLTRQASELFTAGRRARRGAVGVPLATLQGVPAALARRVVQEAWGRLKSGHGLTRRHLGALLRLRSGEGCIRLPGDLCAWVTESVLWLGPAVKQCAAIPESAEMPLRPGRWVRWKSGGCLVRVRCVSGAEVRLDAHDRRRELLSAALFREPLCLRGWRPGDRFGPLGLRGEKKLQDFFVDARVPREARTRIPLLVAGERIAWVVGHRIAEEFRWQGDPTACLAEVRFVEAPHGVSSGSHPAVGG
jgi:tRNA(Ile)-lysidine synthase